MKKLVLSLAVIFSVSLFSCGGAQTETATEEAAAPAAEAVCEQADSCCQADSCVKVDSTAVEAPAEAAK